MLFETGLPTRYYLPLTDVRLDLLRPSSSETYCPYKGVATYLSLEAGALNQPDVAWIYRTPLPESQKIAGLVELLQRARRRLRGRGAPGSTTDARRVIGGPDDGEWNGVASVARAKMSADGPSAMMATRPDPARDRPPAANCHRRAAQEMRCSSSA